MSEIYTFEDNTMVFADYKNPSRHKHLAYHVLISLDEKIDWNIDGKSVLCRGICISDNVDHVGRTYKNGVVITFLFPAVSAYAYSLKKNYLKSSEYAVIDEKIVDKVSDIYHNFINDKEEMDKRILQTCHLDKNENKKYDERVQMVISYIKNAESIDSDIVDKLCRRVFLSKSRLSHIFRSETGMTLKNYLSLQKLKKTYEYLKSGMNITDSAVMAGFSSPSHCAATCKRMFGISISDFYKQ